LEELERRKDALEKRLGRPLEKREEKPIDWNKVHIQEKFEDLFDYSKPLLPQLQRKWCSCFYPELQTQQLIKYSCPQCHEEGKYKSCNFFEAISLHKFQPLLEKIQKSKSIEKPIFQPTAIRRICRGRIPLEKILKASWPLVLHKKKEPEIYTPEHRQWVQDRITLQQKLPCESTCRIRDYCNFYINDFNSKLCVTTIESSDEDNVYLNFNYSLKTYRGYRVDSHLYKKFITPTNIQELPSVKNDGSFKSLDNFFYKTYENILNSIKGKPEVKVIVPKYILDFLATKDGSEELLWAYLWGRTVNFDIELLKEKDFMLDFEKLIDTLKKYELIGTLEQVLDKKKVRRFYQKFSHFFTPTSDKVIEVNLTFLEECMKQRKLEWLDPFYELHLFCEKTPSRKELNDRFDLSRHTQIVIERRLKVRKDFRNKGAKQLSNAFLVNGYCADYAFKILSEDERKEKLNSTINCNREKLNNKSKLTNNQLEQLNQLHNQLKSNREN